MRLYSNLQLFQLWWITHCAKWSLRAPAPLHLSDLPLSLSLPLSLPLLLDLVERQDFFLLLTGWLAFSTLCALERRQKRLEKEGERILCWSRTLQTRPWNGTHTFWVYTDESNIEPHLCLNITGPLRCPLHMPPVVYCPHILIHSHSSFILQQPETQWTTKQLWHTCLLTRSLLLVLTLMTGSPLDLSITTVLSSRPAQNIIGIVNISGRFSIIIFPLKIPLSSPLPSFPSPSVFSSFTSDLKKTFTWHQRFVYKHFIHFNKLVYFSKVKFVYSLLIFIATS